MKTTVEISDALLAEAKTLAAQRGTTLRALIERGLRDVVGGEHRRHFKLRSVTVEGNGLRPEIGEGAWEDIRRLAYEGRGG